MRKFVATLFAAVAMLWAVPNVANAQGVQLYSVVVLDSMVLVPPLPAVTIHDGTDNNQVFPVQTWLATTTGTSGATVTLEAQSAFTHVATTSSKRDAQLDLAVLTADPGSGWAVSTASDVTDHANGDNIALVSAASTGAGLAQLGLTVTFVETGASTLNAGAYTMLVVGTISGN